MHVAFLQENGINNKPLFLEVGRMQDTNQVESISFGAGRRICPGMTFGLVNVEFALAMYLYHFDWKLPNGMKHEDMDMAETSGLTARRKADLHLIPTPYHLVAS